MGARARWGFVAIGLPDDVWESDFAERLYDGYLGLAEHYGVELEAATFRAHRRISLSIQSSSANANRAAR